MPKQVKDNVSTSLQGAFMKAFNRALQQYGNETKAFKIAWSVIRKIGKKNKAGKWVKASSRITASVEMIDEEISKEIE